MEETRYWMWPKRKLDLSSSCGGGDSWVEQAFAEDAAGALGGCVWPPRSYTCSFCRREFRSAQALGGHMNVHRRDRARLKQSPPSDHEGTGVPHGNNPVLAPSVSWDINVQYPSHRIILGSNLGSDVNNGKKKNYSRVLEDLKKNIDCDERVIALESRCRAEDEDDMADLSRKRRRIDGDDDDDNHLFGYDPKPCLVDRCLPRPQPEEELDLELRLGNPPKVK